MALEIAQGRRRIYLMRHGEVNYFDDGGKVISSEKRVLSKMGLKQARMAGKLLQKAHVRPDRVVTSSLTRTVQTAKCVLDELHCDLHIEEWEQFCEIKGGPLSTIAATDIEREFQRAFVGVISEDTRYMRGETFGSLIDRVHDALNKLIADYSWDTLLLVLHGGVNRAILSYALTGTRQFLGNFQQSPGCINVLDVDSEWVVRAVNIHPSDPAHMRTRLTTMEEAYQQYLKNSHGSQ